MTEKYIRVNNRSYTIIKNSKNYGKFASLDDARFFRDELIDNAWDLDSIKPLYKFEDTYFVVSIDGKINLLEKYKRKPSQKTIDGIVKKYKRNPNSSKYGLNITKVFDTFVIKKQIAGEDCIFGYYNSLEDAEFVRNFLLDNHWNLGAFKQIEFDEETNSYKVLEVIGDKIYVLDSFKTKEDINLNELHEKFLNKIFKHKHGLAQHPDLDELRDKIPALEDKFNIEVQDEVWSFKESKDPLNDIIFNLTPFQQSVYDEVNNSSFEDIKKSLIRFKSKNFDEKIQKNLEDLIKSDLIVKNGNYYDKK